LAKSYGQFLFFAWKFSLKFVAFEFDDKNKTANVPFHGGRKCKNGKNKKEITISAWNK
jgi:hypothetical protein